MNLHYLAPKLSESIQTCRSVRWEELRILIALRQASCTCLRRGLSLQKDMSCYSTSTVSERCHHQKIHHSQSLAEFSRQSACKFGEMFPDWAAKRQAHSLAPLWDLLEHTEANQRGLPYLTTTSALRLSSSHTVARLWGTAT